MNLKLEEKDAKIQKLLGQIKELDEIHQYISELKAEREEILEKLGKK